MPAPAYHRPVRDIQVIRLHNFRFLLQECVAENKREHGAQTLLSTKTGVKKSLISMLAAGAIHSDTAKQRQIGDDTANKLESGMGKDPGWLDVDRSEARDFKEAAHLDMLRKLSPSQRDAVERMMRELAGPASPPSDKP